MSGYDAEIFKIGREDVQGDERRCRPSTFITVVKTARIDKEFSENRQVTIQDVIAKIKKRKWLFVKNLQSKEPDL